MSNIKRIIKNILVGFFTFCISFVITIAFILFISLPVILSGEFDNKDFYFLYFIHVLILFYFMGKEYNE